MGKGVLGPIREGGKMEREIFEKVLQALEETPYSFTREGVKVAVEKVASELGLSPEEVLDAAAKVISAEERDRGLKALEGLWRALWNSPPHREAVKALEGGKRVRVWYSRSKWPTAVVVEIGEEMSFPLWCAGAPKEFHFEAWKGGARVVVASALTAEWNRAFFWTQSLSKVKEVLKGTKRLLPLFSSMGLKGLEKALEALLALEDGEVRTEGPYVLARGRGFWVLRRGSVFGDPVSDGKFLLGEEVVLTYPGDVTVALRGELVGNHIRIQEGYLRWGEEVVRFGSMRAFSVLPENFARKLLREELERALPHVNSTRMRTLLEELAARRDPLKVQEGFTERVKMRALAKM
jgi:hypothetical protein